MRRITMTIKERFLTILDEEGEKLRVDVLYANTNKTIMVEIPSELFGMAKKHFNDALEDNLTFKGTDNKIVGAEFVEKTADGVYRLEPSNDGENKDNEGEQ